MSTRLAQLVPNKSSKWYRPHREYINPAEKRLLSRSLIIGSLAFRTVFMFQNEAVAGSFGWYPSGQNFARALLGPLTISDNTNEVNQRGLLPLQGHRPCDCPSARLAKVSGWHFRDNLRTSRDNVLDLVVKMVMYVDSTSWVSTCREAATQVYNKFPLRRECLHQWMC